MSGVYNGQLLFQEADTDPSHIQVRIIDSHSSDTYCGEDYGNSIKWKGLSLDTPLGTPLDAKLQNCIGE